MGAASSRFRPRPVAGCPRLCHARRTEGHREFTRQRASVLARFRWTNHHPTAEDFHRRITAPALIINHLRCFRSGFLEDASTEYKPNLIARTDPELGSRLERLYSRIAEDRPNLVGDF